MKVNLALTGEEIQKLQAVYTKEPASPVALTAASLRVGAVGLTTPSRRCAVVGFGPLQGDPLSARDSLYLQTDVALGCLNPQEGVLGFVEQAILSLPDSRDEAFSCTPLDFNYCRLKGSFGDLQRAEIVRRVGDYDKFKKVVADNIELLAKDSRDYVLKSVGDAMTLKDGLSAPDLEAVQAFNHLRRVMGSVFKLPIEDGEVYLDAKPNESQSLDDAEAGGMNHVFSGISYSGSQRPFYLKYIPYYLLSMEGSKFLNALSRPRQLSAVTTRPGPLTLPRPIELAYGVPEGTKVTYHPVSRFGETNQRSNNANKSAGPPMQFYYSYEDKGVTRVVTLDRSHHKWVQGMNRPPLEIPPGVINNSAPVEAKYKWYSRNHGYIYAVGRTEHALTQAQHQKVLLHNSKRLEMTDPNCPVHMTHSADGSLDTVMNKLFNTLAARAATNKNYIVDLLPKGHRDRMKLMKEVMASLRPDFEREQQRIEAVRLALFEEFANDRRQKDTIEDICRKEARASFRALVEARRVAVPRKIGVEKLKEAVRQINEKFDRLYLDKADGFTKYGAARALYKQRVEPFRALIEANRKKHCGQINVSQVLEEVSAEDRKVFDAMSLHVRDQMETPGGLRDALQATYWGGVTQHLMDQFYGPEGIHADGEYIGREGLPRNSAEFLEYLGKNAVELESDPVQVANRLSKTFANFAFNVSPFYAIPWPNLYRKNDLLRPTGQANSARDQRTVKPEEPPVTLHMNVDVIKDGVPSTISVPMTGKEPQKKKQELENEEVTDREPSPELAEVAGMA
jgi:hypothetical protein